MRTHLVLTAFSLGLSLTCVGATALAAPVFPSVVQTHLGLSYTPPCTICHDKHQTPGMGTATTAFAIALKQAGLNVTDPTSVNTALDTLQTNGTDSDCDGTPDIAQLKEGRDPNAGEYIDGSGKAKPPGSDAGCSGGGSTTTPATPAFGCGAQIAPTTSLASEASLLVIGALLLSRRRRSSA